MSRFNLKELDCPSNFRKLSSISRYIHKWPHILLSDWMTVVQWVNRFMVQSGNTSSHGEECKVVLIFTNVSS